MLVALTAMGYNSGRLHEKHAVAAGNVGNLLIIRLKTEKDQENLCPEGRSQDLPYAYKEFNVLDLHSTATNC
jgi:hypothetical protein